MPCQSKALNPRWITRYRVFLAMNKIGCEWMATLKLNVVPFVKSDRFLFELLENMVGPNRKTYSFNVRPIRPWLKTGRISYHIEQDNDLGSAVAFIYSDLTTPYAVLDFTKYLLRKKILFNKYGWHLRVEMCGGGDTVHFVGDDIGRTFNQWVEYDNGTGAGEALAITDPDQVFPALYRIG